MTDNIKSNTKQILNPTTGQYQTVNIYKSSNNLSKFTVKQHPFNNDAYDITIVLDNGSQQIGINPHSIIYFQLNDTLNTWYMTGEMVVQYHTEAVENGSTPDDNNSIDTYVFRNDGFDFLKINISPTPPLS